MTESDSYAAKLRETDPLREPTLRQIITWLQLPSGSHGLDVGCGIGTQALMLAEAIGPEGRVTGVDTSAEFVRMAEATVAAADKPTRERTGQPGLAERVTFRQGDMYRLPFEDDSFDWLWSADCAGYQPAPDPVALLKELARVVKPGGRVTLLAWSHQQLLPGYPLLEARLNATAGGIAPFRAGMQPGQHFVRGLGWLREAGLVDFRTVAFTGSINGPLTNDIKAGVQALIGMRWPGAKAAISAEDWSLFCRLTDPKSPDYLLDREDYVGFYTYVVHTGRVG